MFANTNLQHSTNNTSNLSKPVSSSPQPQVVRNKPRELTEKEKMAQSLFMGLASIQLYYNYYFFILLWQEKHHS